MAELLPSAFYSDSLMLTEHDLAKLMLGHILEVGGIKVGYRTMPDNGCPCQHCRARLHSPTDAQR